MSFLLLVDVVVDKFVVSETAPKNIPSPCVFPLPVDLSEESGEFSPSPVEDLFESQELTGVEERSGVFAPAFEEGEDESFEGVRILFGRLVQVVLHLLFGFLLVFFCLLPPLLSFVEQVVEEVLQVDQLIPLKSFENTGYFPVLQILVVFMAVFYEIFVGEELNEQLVTFLFLRLGSLRLRSPSLSPWRSLSRSRCCRAYLAVTLSDAGVTIRG